MRTTHRQYSEEAGDFRRLAQFILENNEQVRGYSTWCIGRFVDWKYGLYENKTAVPDFTNRNAHLWFDGFDNLAGFVISENGSSEVAILTTVGYRFLFPEMLQWAVDNWGDRSSKLTIEVTELQSLELRALEKAGFERKFEFFTQAFDLTQPPQCQFELEEGFTIVDMATHPDYRAQRILRDDAFSGRSDVPEDVLQHELLFYNYLTQSPIYHANTDLCVMAEDGRFVAGCEALIDTRNAEADIERVCTHSAFRKRGFARAVIQECLMRLHDMGMRKAYITGYSEAAMALYGSMGASEAFRAFGWETAVS